MTRDQHLLDLQVQFEQSRDACYEKATTQRALVGYTDWVYRENVIRGQVWDLAARCLDNALR